MGLINRNALNNSVELKRYLKRNMGRGDIECDKT